MAEWRHAVRIEPADLEQLTDRIRELEALDRSVAGRARGSGARLIKRLTLKPVPQTVFGQRSNSSREIRRSPPPSVYSCMRSV